MFANRIVALYSRRGAQCVFTWYEKSNTIIGLHGPRKVHPAHVRMYINVCLRLMRKIKQVFPSKHCSTWIQKENIATELFFFTSVRVPGRSRSFGPLTFWKIAKKKHVAKAGMEKPFCGWQQFRKALFFKT